MNGSRGADESYKMIRGIYWRKPAMCISWSPHGAIEFLRLPLPRALLILEVPNYWCKISDRKSYQGTAFFAASSLDK